MSLSTLRKQDESHETPDLQDLLTHLSRLVEWETFGGLMGVPSHVLGSIKAENSTIQSRVTHLLDYLVKNVKDLSWKRVIEALEKIPNEKHLTKTFPQYQTLHDLARVVPLKEEEGFGRSLDDITLQFTFLVSKIEKALREEANLDDVLSFVSNLCQVSEPQPQTIRELFNRLQPHYSFMSYKTLQVIVSKFVMEAMREHMEKYNQELTQWLKSTTVQEFKEAVETAASEAAVDPSPDQCPVVLRLEGEWLDITLHNLRKLLEYLFKKKSSILTRLRIEDGSVLVQLLAPQSEMVSLLALASRKHQEMVYLGIVSIQVGPLSFSATHITVAAFTFEASLGAAICERCNKALIQFLLDIGTDPDGDDPVQTPLLLAAMSNNTEALSLLIKYNADIHMFNRQHLSAIHMAAYSGNKQVVELLLKAGVSPDHHDPFSKFTPLMGAAISNHEDIVYLLLQKGADKDFRNVYSYSALMLACESGSVQSALLLLEAGANPNMKTIANMPFNLKGGKTALYIACEKVPYNPELEELVKVLLMKYNADPNISLDDGRTPLMTACYYRQHKVVNLLLQSGAYVNKQTDSTMGKNTALLLAIQQTDTALVSLLLKSNADVNVQNINGCTALGWACHRGNDEMIQCLLKARADPKIYTNKRISPLLIYISSFDPKKSSTVAALLKAGANPNIPDIYYNRSPLHAACLYHHKDIVSLLLKAKAKVNTLDFQGNTPLCLAAYTCHEEAIKQLLEASADTELEQNSSGWTPIFYAVASGHLGIVELLIQHGANIKRNRYGQTPLDLAAYFGHIEILDALSQANQTSSQAVVKAKHQIKKSMLVAAQTKDDKSKQVTKAKNPLEDDLQSPYDLMASYNNFLSTFSPGHESNEQLQESKMKHTYGLQALEATKTHPKIAFSSI
ncbi:PREDICTED: ankyrin repeat domain-containing protein 50-like [Amphimedon queenslandica]|uniref:Uncharacterized protein n=1 Tax=Amphimedon queenslandica TaxID=400682 RepID=A0A1X7UW96_AMPQE|nr:PREDICTED: ankyrin repeat domain-containing protein 50-like [Amphimedon queenslandica]|eukprot:XP_011403949.1 PREDICTED: ankyrin repeat domain-containing protein 50-like [Amphimedon queenslandica]